MMVKVRYLPRLEALVFTAVYRKAVNYECLNKAVGLQPKKGSGS